MISVKKQSKEDLHVFLVFLSELNRASRFINCKLLRNTLGEKHLRAEGEVHIFFSLQTLLLYYS